MNPTISIITPNFNSAAFIHATYQSISNQTYSNWEWIVVDDGSTDNSPEFVQEWAKDEPRIKFYTRAHLPKGASACRNIGVEHAKGEFALFLDADDLLEPFCLEQRLQYMKQNPSLDFAVFKMGYFHTSIGDISGIVNHFNSDKDQYLKDFISYSIPWAITCPIWKSEFLRKNNIRFSEKYQRLQDPEFHAKILLLHQPAFNVLENSEIDCYYRQSIQNKSKTNVASLKKTTEAVFLYYTEIAHLIKTKQPEYNILLDAFITNIFHSLLFYTRLPATAPIIELYKQMSSTRLIKNLKLTTIRLFAFFNYLGITFIKGAGVSRLWKVIN